MNEEMLKLVNKVNKYSYDYYCNDNPSISDKQFDYLYDKLVAMEKETGIVLPNSPTLKIGGEILKGFKKVNHNNKLWSLDKRQSFEEVKVWLNKCETFVKEYNETNLVKLPPLEYTILKKFDGLSVKTKYIKDIYVQASSRGNGLIGEDFTEQVRTTINLPLELNHNDNIIKDISFHGEELMTKKAFEEYNKKASTPLKNLRNGVAGALRNLNVSETAKRKPIIYFYNINEINGSNELSHFKTYEQQLEYMKLRGLPVAEYVICNTYEEIVQAINDIEEQRPTLAFDIDGAVIAINDLATRQAMGYTEKFPRFSLAYKYEAEETTTKLIDVEWNVSRYGRLNPTGILEPTDLCGSTVGRATLNNIEDIERKGIKINAEVFLRKSNDVIPEITSVIDESLNNEDIIDITYPTKCICCNSPTEIKKDNETRYLYCTNDNCPDKIIQQLTHYASKEAVNIVGLSIETIRQFIKYDFIKEIKDIYNLEQYKEQIIKIPKFGIKKYNNLIGAINNSKACKLNNFLYALGIEGVGKKASKNICEYFNNDFDKIMTVGTHEYLKIEDIGDTIANSIVGYFSETKTVRKVNEVIGYINFIEDEVKEIIVTQQTLFQGKSVYPTGGFNMKKAELKTLLESLGTIVETGYKVKLDYLICGHDMSKSGKDKKAIDDNAIGKSNITIITEDEFLQIIKGN